MPYYFDLKIYVKLYWFSYTNTANTFTVDQNIIAPIINATPISTNSVIGCGVNSSVTYSANVTNVNGTPNYSWSPSGGSGGNTSPVFNATIAGTYTLLVTNTLTGCSSTKTVNVIGNSNIPNLNSAATVTTPCGSTITVLSASSTNTNVGYTWTGPSNANIIGSSTSSPTVNIPGSYVVTVTDLLTGCTNSKVVSIIEIIVKAGFTANPTTGVAPLEVNFTNTSTGASNYSWNFGNTLTSTNTNPNTIYNVGGTYTVTLIATYGSCHDTLTKIIIIDDELSVVIPNVFTPNGDGINDVFLITATGVKEISLSIYNRWGTKLYEYNGIKASWDGIIAGSGDKAVDGTYYYMLNTKGFDNKEIIKQGTVNLFRWWIR